MIGQSKLKKEIENLINNNSFPQTYLIIGKDGQGKRTAADYIANQLNYNNYITDNKADSIRDLIEYANGTSIKTHYTIVDIDKANIIAQNALLKIIEEPPINSIFCLTCSTSNILNTIKSRAVTFNLQPYSRNELEEYCKLNNIKINIGICDNIADIIKLNELGYDEVLSYANNIYNNIGNILRLLNQNPKYDLDILFKMFIKVSIQNNNAKYVAITSKYIDELCYNIKASMVYDNWLLELRAVS